MPESNSKLCRRCGESKPIFAFAKHAGKDDGLQPWCRQCKVEVQRQLRAVKPPNPVSCSSKTCSTCKELKPASAFGRCASGTDGLQVQCKACKAMAHKKNYVPNPRVLKVRVPKPVKMKPVYPDGHKRCPKCDGVKPFDSFGSRKSSKSGLSVWCKDCKNTYTRGIKANTLFTGLLESAYTCQKCDTEKNLSEFYKHKRDGVQPWCKTCFKANKANYQIKKRQKATAACVEKTCIQCNTTRPAAEFRSSRRCVDSRSLRCKECDAKSLVYAKAVKTLSARKREYIMGNARPRWADGKAIRAIYNKARALEKKDGIRRHVDHIVPVRHKLVCGLHVANNLQILTERENLKKGNKFEIQ